MDCFGLLDIDLHLHYDSDKKIKNTYITQINKLISDIRYQHQHFRKK
jgi:hypothetical protein